METHSAERKSKERMGKIDIEFEAMLQLEQAQFAQRRLALEMPISKIETEHQLLEEKRELERKVKKTALENDENIQSELETKYSSIGTQGREMSRIKPENLTSE